MQQKWGVRWLTGVLVALMLAACSSGGAAQPAPSAAAPAPAPAPAPAKKDRQVAVIAISTNPVTLDPGATASGVDATIFYGTIYESLTGWNADSFSVRPGLAESWDASPDGKEWTFHLRKGVKFHDGTPFNADAVKFNFDRQLDPKHPNAPKEAPMGDFTLGSVQAVKVVDDNTVKLTLKFGYAPLLANLTIFNLGIASPTAIKKYGADYYKNPVGTGPFKFESWQPDVAVNLVRNDQWWDAEGPSKVQYPYTKPGNDKRPYLDGIVYKLIPQLNVQTEELVKGNVHWLYNISTDDIARLQKEPTIAASQGDVVGTGTGYLGFNVTQKPFDNLKLRQAVAMAIDKASLGKNLYGGWFVPAKSLIMPPMLGYPKDMKDWPYDPAAAKKLLGDAGYPGGLTVDFYTHSNPRSTNPKAAKLAEALQPMLAAIGITTNIKVLEWPAYQAALKDGTPGMFTLGWGSDNYDPDNTDWFLLSSKNIPAGNRTRYNNPKVDELLDKAQQLGDPNERAKLYQQVEQIVHDEVPLIPLVHTLSAGVWSKNLKGVAKVQQNFAYWWIDSSK